MSRSSDEAARATNRRIDELLKESGLQARRQKPTAWKIDVYGTLLPSCLRTAYGLLQALGPDASLDQAKRTGGDIEIVLGDRNWRRNKQARGTRLFCRQVARHLATADSLSEADQFASMLRLAIRRYARDLTPVGEQETTTRLEADRRLGRQLAAVIRDGRRGRFLRRRVSGPVEQCLLFADALADANTEDDAEQWSDLLEAAFERYQYSLAKTAVPYPHLSTVYDSSSRLAAAQSIGRQIVELLRRTDLHWQSTVAPEAATDCLALADCLSLAGQLAGASTEADAERFATLLGQAIRTSLPDLAGRPALYSDLQVMAVQTERVAFGLASAGLQWLGGGQLSSERELPPIVKRTTHMFIYADPLPAKELVRRWVQAGPDPGRTARCALRFAVGVLPVPAQARYAEEWTNDLWLLRDTPKLRRAGHAVRLASRALLLRHNLRRSGTALWTEPREPG